MTSSNPGRLSAEAQALLDVIPRRSVGMSRSELVVRSRLSHEAYERARTELVKAKMAIGNRGRAGGLQRTTQARRPGSKALATKSTDRSVYRNNDWTVLHGVLQRRRGRPTKVDRLFTALGEKIPLEALSKVEQDLRSHHPEMRLDGIYLAHDSMGQVRYVGRGQVFNRLRERSNIHRLQLAYFSFYLVKNKNHERELETLLIRSVGAQAHFNTRKKQVAIVPGDVRDYEPGTVFYERQAKRGRKAGPA